MGDALENKKWPMNASLSKAFQAYMDLPPDPTEEVGLDFDLFSNSQDFCSTYKADGVTQAAGRYRVELFDRGCSGPPSTLPRVVAEIEWQGGSWVFTDFIYPDTKEDFFSVLKELTEDNEKHLKGSGQSPPGRG